MATYAIGDVQGCLASLQHLLTDIHYRAGTDTLWFAGDLVNRGPDSLGTLRFVMEQPHVVTVLGNHDLHLLALGAGAGRKRPQDTLDPVLEAPDRSALLEWLKRQPLLHHDPARNLLLAHAGVLPLWTSLAAVRHARSVEQKLARADATWFQSLYGNTPAHWDEQLLGAARDRLIVNALTRMRYCDARGGLELTAKGPAGTGGPGLAPWFEQDVHRAERVLFGHWSALGVGFRGPHFSLDGGCVWGGDLVALRLDDWRTFSVPCPRYCADGKE